MINLEIYHKKSLLQNVDKFRDLPSKISLTKCRLIQNADKTRDLPSKFSLTKFGIKTKC